MRPFLLLIVLVCFCTPLTSQIESWKKVVDPMDVFGPYRDSIYSIEPMGPPAVYRDSTIAIACKRDFRDSASSDIRREVLIAESTNQGVSWTLIGRVERWPGLVWAFGISSMHYLSNGDLVAQVSGGYFRYRRSDGQWIRVWANDVVTFGGGPPRIAAHATGDFLLGGSESARVSLEADTLTRLPDGITTDVTPANYHYSVGWRRPDTSEVPDVYYIGKMPDGEFRNQNLWSPALGLAVGGGSMGDDEGRIWESFEFNGANIERESRLRIAQNGTIVMFTPDANFLKTSNDLGRTWTNVGVPFLSADTPIPISNRHGRTLFVAGAQKGVIFCAVAPSMPMGARWPKDSSQHRLDVQTLVCPAHLHGEIEVVVDTSAAFDSPMLTQITRERYVTVRELEPHSTFVWKYRHRNAESDPWGAWSAAWAFSTGGQAFWRYLGQARQPESESAMYYRLMNGTYVKVMKKSKVVYVASDNTLRWDSVCTLAEVPNQIYETPVGRLFVRGSAKMFHVNLVSRTATPVSSRNPYIMVADSPNWIFATSDRNALVSSDDGDNWTVVTDWMEGVTSIVIDQDGSVLYGCVYAEIGRPYPQPSSWIGGARRLDPRVMSMTQVGANILDLGSDQVVMYGGMRRDIDGKLYCVSNYGQFGVFSSVDDGTTWSKINPSTMPKWGKHVSMWSDRDRRAIMLFDTMHLMRRYNDVWEPFDAGIYYAEVQQSVETSSVTTLRDGSLIYSTYDHAWILDRDAHTFWVRPAAREVLPTNRDIKFAWHPVKEASGYLIELEPGARTYETGPVTELTVSPLSAGTYTWRIQTIVDGVRRAWSAPTMFVTSTTTGVVDDADYDAENAAGNGAVSKHLQAAASKPLLMTRATFERMLSESAHHMAIADLRGLDVVSIERLVLPAIVTVTTGEARRVVMVVD